MYLSKTAEVLIKNVDKSKRVSFLHVSFSSIFLDVSKKLKGLLFPF